MMFRRMIALAAVALATATVLPAAESFRLVTYNLENYIDTKNPTK